VGFSVLGKMIKRREIPCGW